MQLTQHTDFGLRMMIYLALRRPETATVGEIAGALQLSSHHLTKVAQELRRRDILVVHRGRSGGLELAREPEEIAVGEAVRALETFHVVECFREDKNECVLTPSCKLQGVLSEATDAFLGVLDQYTLADLVRQPARVRRLVGLG